MTATRCPRCVRRAADPGEGYLLASWKQLLDDGRMQDGDDNLRATARRPVLLVGPVTLAEIGVVRGRPRSRSPDRSVPWSCLVGEADLADGTVWAPASAPGGSVRHRVGPAGCRVTITGRCRMIPLALGRSPSATTRSWVVILKAVLIFVVLVLLTLFNIWWERRVVARMQHRIGPNVNGPFGLLQSLADGVKLALKEDIIPKAADQVVFILAPVIAVIPAFITFSVIPFGPTVEIPWTDITTPLQLTDMPVAVLFVMAIASIGIYGIVLGGWSVGSTYSLLGGLRSSAQMISYEVAMGLALVAVFLYAGSMSTSEIVDCPGEALVRAVAAAELRDLHDRDGR